MHTVQKGKKNDRGFTLAELMIAATILIITFLGILVSYIRCLELSELSRNSSSAINLAKSKIEEIKDETFADVFANYNAVPFTTTGLTGMGVSYVDNSNPDLLVITVTVCWRQSNGRIIGEDTNLNGVLNGGEDTNGNGMLDSKVQLITTIYNY